MIVYYVGMAWRRGKRHAGISLFIVMAIALGVSAPLSVVALVQRLGSDPLPDRSRRLYHPQLEPRPINAILRDSRLPDDLTLQDARALYRLPGAPMGAIMSSNRLPMKHANAHDALKMIPTRATTHEFFDLFGLRFVAGSGWSRSDDADRARVAVLSRKLSRQLFGSENSVGKEMTIATQLFRVIGVVDDWNPKPHFYDLNSGVFANSEDVFMPFETWMGLPQDYGYGPARCWPDADAGRGPAARNCTWVQYWVSLATPEHIADYRALLGGYASSQHQATIFQAPPDFSLRSLAEWIDHKQVVPASIRMQQALGLGISVVCMVSAFGLLLAKFSKDDKELALRRALGASRHAIFSQCLIDASVAGVVGGVIAQPMTWLGFRLIQQQDPAMQAGISMLPSGLWQVLVASLIGTLLIGCVPALRCARVSPALHVKS